MFAPPCSLFVEGRLVATGTYEAIRAVARLFGGYPVNIVERDIMAAMNEAVKQDLDKEVLGELLRCV